MKDRNHTYESISKASGISIATISRVFNKSPLVKDQTRVKVIKAMEDLGMDLSSFDLVPVPSDNLIVFNVPTLKNPFYSPIAESARAAANRKGYSLLINEDPISDETLESFLRLLKKTHAVGLVCTNSITREKIERLKEQLPTVTCCEGVADSPVPFVTVDDEVAAHNAVKYILGLGRRRIALINGPGSFKYARSRYKGYVDALKEAGIAVDKNLIAEIGADMDFDTAKAVAMHMLNSPGRPDAFFCISDVIAASAIKASLELGCRVPEDIVVVGFDDIFISQIMNPTITTVRQPTAQIGALATEMVIKLIEKDDVSINSIYLGTELIIRESSSLGL